MCRTMWNHKSAKCWDSQNYDKNFWGWTSTTSTLKIAMIRSKVVVPRWMVKKHQSNHHFEGWSSLIPKHDVGSTHPICPRCRTMCFTIFNCRWAIRAPWEDRCQGSHMDILSLAVTKWCWQHWHNHVQPSPHVHNDTMCFWIFSPTTAGCARVCGIVGPRSHAPYIGSNMFPWLHMHNNSLHELSITSGLPMCFWIFSPTTAGCARVCGIVGHRSHALQGMVD